MTTGGEKGPVSPEDSAHVLISDIYLHVRDRIDPLFAPPPFIVENVFFSKVGHTFGQAQVLPPGPPPTFLVQDFLLDQTGASGADGKMSATKTFDLTTATSYRFNLFPKDRSKRIKVAPPPSTQVFIGLDLGRKFVNALSDVTDAYPAQSFFVNLAGTAPVLTYNYFFIGRNTNHWVEFVVQQELVSPISFLGFSTIGTYPPRSFDPGLKSYSPFSNSLPFNLPGPNAVPYMVFSYMTTSSSDPGPFVFLG